MIRAALLAMLALTTAAQARWVPRAATMWVWHPDRPAPQRPQSRQAMRYELCVLRMPVQSADIYIDQRARQLICGLRYGVGVPR